jgi:redox-sensing transcriptional repressor
MPNDLAKAAASLPPGGLLDLAALNTVRLQVPTPMRTLPTARSRAFMTEQPDKSPNLPGGPVPKAVVNRLSLYLRELQQLVRGGHETTSSSHLGGLLGFTDAQVRKDLAYFGHFGYPGIGYRCDELIGAIRQILGTNRGWTVAMVGTGNLGRALLGYRGFGHQNFKIVAAFDIDPAKIGSRIEDVPIYHLEQAAEIVRQHKIKLGMIVVPAPAAQSVADTLAQAGIEGIVNFAPVTLVLPPEVSIIGVDLAMELEQLSFAVANRQCPGKAVANCEKNRPPAKPE